MWWGSTRAFPLTTEEDYLSTQRGAQAAASPHLPGTIAKALHALRHTLLCRGATHSGAKLTFRSTQELRNRRVLPPVTRGERLNG